MEKAASRPPSRWRRLLGGICRFGRLAGRPPAGAKAAAWYRDPLSHPALQAMTQRELGDLPFDPRGVADE